MRTPSIRWALLVLAAVGLAACGATPTPPATPTATPAVSASAPSPSPSETGEQAEAIPAEPVIIQIDLGHPPESLDPALVGGGPLDAAANDLVENLFVGLTSLDSDTGQVEPALALRWDISADGLTWVVYLHDDAWWSRISPASSQLERVRPLTADDVVYSVQRACRADTQAPLVAALFVIQGCREVNAQSAEALTPEVVEQTIGARVLNDTTVEFRLARDAAYFPTILSMPVMRPVPADQVEALGPAWTLPENLWTSGAWVIQPGVSASEGYPLIKNTAWFLPQTGNVDVVQVGFDGLSGRGFAAWRAGRLVLSAIPPEEALGLALGADPGYRLMARPTVTFLAVSYDTPPLDNPDVRRALSLALDRQAIVDQVLQGLGLPASDLVPPGTAYAPAGGGAAGSGFDPDAAREALAAAGYEGCAWLPSITVLTGTSELSQQLAALYVGMWENFLGCVPGTFVLAQDEFRNVLHTARVPPAERAGPRPGLIALSWQADYPDAHHWLADIVGCREQFPAAYFDEMRPCVEADALAAQAASLHDAAQRAGLYQAAIEAFFGPTGEMPVIPIYVEARPLAIRPWLTIYPAQAGPLRFDRWVVDTAQMP
jgi:oligopeptide transport system substrate-binding protein